MTDGDKSFGEKVPKDILFLSLKAGLVCLLLAGCLDTLEVGIPGVETDNLLPDAVILSPTSTAELSLQIDSLEISTGSLFPVGSKVIFLGIGIDPEDDSLSTGSLQWSSDLDGELGTGALLTKSDLSSGTHWIFLTATDSQGASGRDSVRITVGEEPELNLAPVVEILTDELELVNEVLYTLAGETLLLNGVATDEDRTLSDTSLIWVNERGEKLGTGKSLDVSKLATGLHKIVLTAADSQGATGRDSIDVYVEEQGSLTGKPPVAPTNLRAETGLLDLVLGLVKVDLNWQDNSENESLFRIEHRIFDSTEFKLSAVVDANTTTERISGLLSGSVYEFRVRAENKFGVSEYSYTSYK